MMTSKAKKWSIIVISFFATYQSWVALWKYNSVVSVVSVIASASTGDLLL